MTKLGRQHLARPVYSDSKTMGVTFKNCGFPGHLKHLLGAWYTVIFFSFVKWVNNEIILTEFVLNCRVPVFKE